MELKVSSPKAEGLSPSDCVSDSEESDDDDDDRNHKHHRREIWSESMERESLEQVLIRPNRKGNRPFENGHLYRENHSQSNETWKSSNMSPLETDLSAKFEKRRSGFATFPQVPNKFYQPLSADLGSGRGRGRESGSWGQHDPRLSIVDIASQMVPQGSGTPSLFAGRGLPNVSDSQSPSWSAFGLIPGIPNGGIPRQRCRDFEERGFCLRGDMCPMEHGVNRIVVEDVQVMEVTYNPHWLSGLGSKLSQTCLLEALTLLAATLRL
ncbi:zinc finger CCCH domain-containing protein 41-like isoform X2 [Actinidia eriantha]|uniref:zinc finger CCCH domain-containing protein 41-like isoform X2 n=1 Tax=Actinidia eriantha TaxID=165200 RepID=UPI00258DFBF5|nr:zinc finger CCCH domain-containing protein 41-like isoform X2 [Actinidia eriantha]